MSASKIPYLELNPEIEEAIKHDRATGRQNPYAFNDENVTRRENNPHDRATLTRTAFARDIEKIINIPAYNRYADKTQVFSFVENDDICRRGLHVQLVSRIARGISDLLGLNTQLVESIALGHDLGHTPFGHSGENPLDLGFDVNVAGSSIGEPGSYLGENGYGLLRGRNPFQHGFPYRPAHSCPDGACGQP